MRISTFYFETKNTDAYFKKIFTCPLTIGHNGSKKLVTDVILSKKNNPLFNMYKPPLAVKYRLVKIPLGQWQHGAQGINAARAKAP
jgi:hypothetical protein